MISILLLLLVTLAVADPLYRKVIHNFDPEAKCIDGSPGLLYVHEGGDTSNILIFMEGGGLCGEETLAKTLESCYQRSKTLLGSSKYWPEQFAGEGYLSSDPSISKFANWTKFILGYCDGALHQGYAPPVKYKDTELYFRGAAITRSHFDWISLKYGLKTASRVVLTGGSAGGIGVHLWNNYLRGYLNNPANLFAIDDSGVFMNAKTTLGDSRIEKMVSNIYKVANVRESTPFAECNQLHKGEEWRCIFIEYGVTVISGKYLVVNSEYDAWAIPNILGVHCLKKGLSGETLSNCSKTELGHIEKYREAFKESMTQLLVVNPEASIWTIACSNHVYACINYFYDSQFQKVPALVGDTVRTAVETFVFSNERVVSFDGEGWPANVGCAK